MNYIRKSLAIFFSVMLMTLLAACGSTESVSEETATQTQMVLEQEIAKDVEQTAATVTDDTTSDMQCYKIVSPMLIDTVSTGLFKKTENTY